MACSAWQNHKYPQHATPENTCERNCVLLLILYHTVMCPLLFMLLQGPDRHIRFSDILASNPFGGNAVCDYVCGLSDNTVSSD